jgi:hypothetical protein
VRQIRSEATPAVPSSCAPAWRRAEPAPRPSTAAPAAAEFAAARSVPPSPGQVAVLDRRAQQRRQQGVHMPGRGRGEALGQLADQRPDIGRGDRRQGPAAQWREDSGPQGDCRRCGGSSTGPTTTPAGCRRTPTAASQIAPVDVAAAQQIGLHQHEEAHRIRLAGERAGPLPTLGIAIPGPPPQPPAVPLPAHRFPDIVATSGPSDGAPRTRSATTTAATFRPHLTRHTPADLRQHTWRSFSIPNTRRSTLDSPARGRAEELHVRG